MIEIFHFLKFQEFINDTELGKTFSIGENGMNPLEILPMQQNVWPMQQNVWRKGPEDKYF